MLTTISTLKDCIVCGHGGEIGTIRDLYFDDVHWLVRYLLIPAVSRVGGEPILVSPVAVTEFLPLEGKLTVDLTDAQAQSCPRLQTERLISRADELAYHQQFGWPLYWLAGSADVYPFSLSATKEEAVETKPPAEEPYVAGQATSRHPESQLVRASDLKGAHVQASDGAIGHVTDLLICPKNWHVGQLAVATKNWWPGKTVVLPTERFHHFDRFNGTIGVDLTRAEIKASPEFRTEILDTADEEGHLAARTQ